MYGFKRSNIQRPVIEHPSLGALQTRGFGIEPLGDGAFKVAGAITFWPVTNYWKTPDGEKFGFGIDTLIAAAVPGASAELLTEIDVAR